MDTLANIEKALDRESSLAYETERETPNIRKGSTFERLEMLRQVYRAKPRYAMRSGKYQ